MSEISCNSISAAVTSLTNSLGKLPSTAIPAIIDCILASTSLSASSLFSSLLDSCNLTEVGEMKSKIDASYIISFASALCYLVKKSGTEPGVLQSFILAFFFPYLKTIDTNDYELLNQIAELLCDVVTENQAWGLMEVTLVSFSLRSLGLSIGMLQNEESAIFQWSRHSLIQRIDQKARVFGLDQEVITFESFPLFIACHILSSLLLAALESCQAVRSLAQPEVVDGFTSSETFARNVLWDLSGMTVRMLSLSAELRSCAVRLLLPFIFRALDVLPTFEVSICGSKLVLSRDCFFRKIWNCCRSLFSRGYLERQDAFSVLSLYLTFLFHIEEHKREAIANGAEEFDVREEKEYWEEIRRGLVDKEALVRKQSLHILKLSVGCYSCSPSGRESQESQQYAVVSETNSDPKNCVTVLSNGSSTLGGPTKRGKWAEKEAKSLGVGQLCNSENSCMNGQQQWEVFLLLYEMLEEFGTHLVEAAWTHQISLLLCVPSSCNSNVNSVRRGLSQIQMEALEGTFSWLAVLWERGFSHENPLVRCLIMQSFLGIDWESHGNCAKLVPESFILGPLVQGLNDPVHHKDFGMKGVYCSKTAESASKFLRHFSSNFTRRERLEFLCRLASVANQESFGRAGLMAFAVCIDSASCGMDKYCNSESWCGESSCPYIVHVESAKDNIFNNNFANLLDALRIFIERSKQHFNSNYRLQVCEHVLEAAVSVMCTCDVPLDVLLHFISTIPHEFTDYGGSLRRKVQQWFWSSTKHNRSNCLSLEYFDLKNLCEFPRRFIMNHHRPDALLSYDDDDFDAWGYEVVRWARVLLIIFMEEHHLEPILTFIQDYGMNICARNSHAEWNRLKFLILVLGLIQELRIGHEKFTFYTADVESGVEVKENATLDELNSSETYFIYEKFTEPFLLILEELISYARSSCSIFWSNSVISDARLPCSVSGKLGGPSKRRLASSTTATVLQAVLSMKTVANLSSWCGQLRNGVWPDSVLTFLWDFSWKVISSPTYDSETGAEICLAAYEALVPVLKALSTAFTPLTFDLIKAYNISAVANGGIAPLLDPLVLNFLQNINNLLDVGALARSRRAVLLNWKWFCLDSLLSIPYHAMACGVNLGTTVFFSDAEVRSIFIDIVESLESAGEGSVLPIFRSVRLAVGLLCSRRSRSIVSSCEGMDSQMMLQLAHSSWILHVSCNKRRVAPIAALLSSVLHSSVFCDLSMHETADNRPGPLKWFVGKVINEGMRSPRTIRLAALHLTGLWLLFPKTIRYYIEELKLLALYGSVAFDEDFEAELTENRDAREEVSLLVQMPDAELTEVFINTEMYARVAVAVLFYKLADLAGRSMENEDASAALHCGRLFLLELLDSAVNDKDLAKELYKKYSAIHRRKVRAWQMICVLSRFVNDDIVQQVTSSMHICLHRNNLPAVRQYLETFAIQIYLKFPLLIEEQLVPIFHNYNTRPQALSSYVFIAANVILHATEVPRQLRHLDKLLPPVIPFLTSHHHSLRAFSQLLVYQVLCKLVPVPVLNSSNLIPLEKRCFMDLKSYLAQNSDCTRLRTSTQGFLDSFDPNTSATPLGIFSARNEGIEFECVPTSLMEQVITFLNDAREDLRHCMAIDVKNIKNESLAVGETFEDMALFLRDNRENSPKQVLQDSFLDFQKKVTLNKHDRKNPDANSFIGNARFHKALLEMENEDLLLSSALQSRSISMEKRKESQQPFILVASLLDRVPNLAGLARTCEVFKASALTVPDASILHDKQFQLISVTAEKWVPIIEVPVCTIKVFLEKKKRQGFSILGLEQTANSVPLDKYSFPKKTVLVLGREKEGIPVDIIHTLDACIEIPQLGVVRSLNVHVSGAIALWEYTRQQRSK